MNWKVALPMYNVSPRLQREYEAFAASLLAQAEVLERVTLLPSPELPSLWHRDDVLLTQTCGYPYMISLRDKVALLATPCFDFDGCQGGDYSSVIVTRAGGQVQALADARGLIAAANDPHSNSGMNVLRHAVSLLADNGGFFGEVKWSGSHAASLRMVRDGDADIAAIDCVTYGYLKQEAPESLDGTTVLHYTVQTPGLPLIMARSVPESLQRRLRDALLSPGAALRAHMKALHIREFRYVTDAEYERILHLEVLACAVGYPSLA